jgi:adenylate cyclase
MSDVFISYARSAARDARAVAENLRAEGYSVWWDQDLPTHRAYSDVIEEQLSTAKAVVVIWSAEAVKSEWVRSEANRAREDHKLVQLTVDAARLPMPFDQIQCADLSGWAGDADVPGWSKVAGSVAELVGRAPKHVRRPPKAPDAHEPPHPTPAGARRPLRPVGLARDGSSGPPPVSSSAARCAATARRCTFRSTSRTPRMA